MAGDVSVEGTDGGDLVLSLGNGDQVTLVGALIGEASVRYGVQSVTFGDGTSWTYNDLMGKANTPTIGKTTIYGGSGADILDTAGTVHTAVGNGGGDSFVYNAGYGAVTVVEHDYSLDQTNTINLGAGILPTDVAVSGTSDGSIVIALGQGDSITIQNALQSNEVENFGVQKVAFADGTNWTYQTLLSKVATAVAGTGTIFGDRSSNVLDTAGLAHKVVGGGGNDTIIFNRGYGEVHVAENDDNALSKNLLAFGQGINVADVSVEGGLLGDITLNTGQGDTVVLEGALKSTDNQSYGVQFVSFNDGTVWTYADLIAKLGTPSTSNGTIYGDASSNYLDGNGLATTAVGGGGGDTFVFNPGYGHLTISEQESSPNRVNILKLGAGIDTTNVTVTADAAGNVSLSHGLNDQVELMSALNGDGNYSYGVQSIQFADGTAWSYGDLVKRSQVSSTLNTVLYGTDLSDDFDSAGFASSIIGNGGGDTFHYGYGHGSLSITEHDDAALPTNVLVFDAGINPSNVSVSATPAGDINLTLDSGETVTLIGAASFAGGTATGVQQVLFDGGLSWSTADIRALAQGHWDISDDGQQHTINEALVPQAAPPTIIVGFASTSATATLGSDRNAVTVTSSNGTAVVISDLMRKGIRTSQVIQYSDGVVQTLGDLIEGSSNTQGIINYAVGTQSAEDIYIDDGINQVLGFGGGDTIHYNLGSGRVTIDEQDVHSHPDNILTFGAGILLSDITVKSDGANLYLFISDTDQVVISNALNSDSDTSYGVQQVRFADGTSQSYEQLLAIADTGSANNDGTLYGDAEGNVIDPNGYSHYVMSGGGNDTIIYRKGYGDISIQDYSQSPGKVATIAFGPDILPSDVDISPNTDRYSASGAMNIGVDGSTIRIDYEMIGDDPIIGALSFSDGTVLTYADMLAKMATPVAGKFAIGGDFGANTLDTQGLVYTAVGNGGGDTFIYNRTYGALTIKEYDNSPSPANRLLFGSTITPEDVAVSLSYNGLYKLDLGNGDSVTFDAGQFSSKDGVQSVEFADGTAWDEDRLLLEANSGHPGKVSIEGTYLNETFDSRGYSRIISGRAGDDTYVFNSGYGALTVIDGSYYNQNTDTVAFGSGITATDLVASRYGDNLILSLGSSDRLVLYNQFVPSNGYKQGVTNFAFADGSNLSASYFTDKANIPSSGMAPIIGSSSEIHTSLILPSSSSTMTSNGYVDFEDTDAGDIHSVSVVSVDYETSSYAVLPYREEMLNYLSAGITTEPSVNGDGKVSWSFSAPSSTFDALAPGETVDVKFTVEIKDQNNSLVYQDVVVSVASPLSGTQSTPHISGTSGDDTLNLDTNFIVNPGAGNDSLYTSYYGSGSIQFAAGDGHDTLFDYASYITRTDNLLLTDVDPSGVTISRDGDSLTIHLDATGDSFTAANQFTGTSVGLQNVQFANGVIWDRDEINARANATTPTPIAPENVGGSPDEGDEMNSSAALRRNDVDMPDFRSGYIKVAFDPFSEWAHVLDDSRAMGDIAGSITGSDSASPAFHSTKLANLYASNHVRDF
nr:calcium-binding protein [Sphingomonas sp. CFBP 13603]